MTVTLPGDTFIIGGVQVPGLIQAVFPLTLPDYAIRDLMAHRVKVSLFPVWHGLAEMVPHGFDGCLG